MDPDDIAFLKEMLESMNNNQQMTQEFIKKDLALAADIKREVRDTRIMIHKKYHLFGAMMSTMLAIMANLMTHSMIEPWKVSPQIQTSVSLFVTILILIITLGVWWSWGREIFSGESLRN